MFIPFLAIFNVLSTGVSDEISVDEGEVTRTSQMSLVLAAEPETQIILSTGEHLSSVEIPFTLVMPAESHKFGEDMSDGKIGYLIHTDDGVHGAALWPDQQLPYYLLLPDFKPSVSIRFASLSVVAESAEPYCWQKGREHILSIASFNTGGGHDNT